MHDATIHILKPNVTQQDAARAFSASGLTAFYWNLRLGSFQRLASAYVPFRMYRVSYKMNRVSTDRLFALDAVTGSLDLFSFARIPSSEQMQTIETRNFLEPALADEDAARIVRDKVLRLIFQQGFFKLRGRQIEIQREPVEFHIPYWLGFYGGRGSVRFRVIDAVRRRVEGAKATAFFEQWLAATL